MAIEDSFTLATDLSQALDAAQQISQVGVDAVL